MAILFLIIFLAVLAWNFIDQYFVVKNLQEEVEKYKKKSEVSVKQSKAVIRGQVSEQLVPILKNFPYNLSDIKFSGQPIDYLVYEGMSNLRDTGEGEITIIFADVKSNSSRNSKIQNAIKEAIRDGRVIFENWHIDQEGNLNIK